MAFVITCTVAPGALATLRTLRAEHLGYIRDHRGRILFGGPARGSDGAPETMIIVLRTDERAAAEAFIAAEPYTASGQVFAGVQVRPWSQVVPEPSAGALDQAVAQAERARGQV